MDASDGPTTPLKVMILNIFNYANKGRYDILVHSSSVGPMIEEFVSTPSRIKISKSIVTVPLEWGL